MMSCGDCWMKWMSYVLLSDICDTPRVTFIDLDFTSISSTPSRLHQRLSNIFVSDPPPLLFWRHMKWFINRNRDNVTSTSQMHVKRTEQKEQARVSWKCSPAEWREGQGVSVLAPGSDQLWYQLQRITIFRLIVPLVSCHLTQVGRGEGGAGYSN